MCCTLVTPNGNACCICVLEGQLEYERSGRKSPNVTKARKTAENYLLERRMFRWLRTGEVIDERWLRFSFPTFWHYDVLRGLDYLRNAGIKPDGRVREAIETVIARRHQNGRWPLNLLHREHIPLEMETVVGGASRWNTHCAPCESCVGTTTQCASYDFGPLTYDLGRELPRICHSERITGQTSSQVPNCRPSTKWECFLVIAGSSCVLS